MWCKLNDKDENLEGDNALRQEIVAKGRNKMKEEKGWLVVTLIYGPCE
jgi:hypothetical protein